jgi:hypothetical protein
MKRIELKCCCGASITLIDQSGTYLKAGGQADEKGRRFVVDVQADAWLDRHDKCLPSHETISASASSVSDKETAP